MAAWKHAYIDLCYLYLFAISISNTHPVQLELIVYTSNAFASANTVATSTHRGNHQLALMLFPVPTSVHVY